MSSLWHSFVPHDTVIDLLQRPFTTVLARADRVQAVALFADVSGFTAMSEALAAMGKSGAEELTRILNRYFEPMIDLIHAYGGVIGKFGGDAMTVLFPYTAESLPATARRAAQCALDMQARMADYAAIHTPGGTFSLTMKVGIAAGPVFYTNVGDPDIRLEYVIAGSALDRCADAEHHAASGDIVVSAAVLAAIGPAAAAPLADGAFHRLLALPETAVPAPLPPLPPLPPAVRETLAAFVHPSIAQRLRRGQVSFLNEHRKVTVLFVRFAGYAYDTDPDVGDRLQDYFGQVVRIVQRYDGYLNKVDMGDKGSKYVILFGAPIAHEDDAERALRCAWELSRLPEMPVQVGINTGFVYCGQVGSPRRQEYTVMGDAVNLAARLMQAAAVGQVLVSQATRAAAGAAAFAWGDSTQIRVKGKAQPIQVHVLAGTGRRATAGLLEPRYALPMVGRAAELALLLERWQRARGGQGQVVGITAEAGMGKSRLTAEFIQQVGAENGRFLGACQSYGTTTNYLVWQALLAALFALDADAGPEAQLRQLRARLAAADPQLVPRLPLLGVALNLAIPDNELTAPMDAQLRKSSLEALVADYVAFCARERPLLLVLEDCHWLDPLSNDLLEGVARAIADLPVLLLLVYRPPETERIQPRVRRFGHFTEIRLADFSPAEAAALIALKLARLFGETAVPPTLVARITERAQGNPFYIDEMINLIHDQGVDPGDTAALAALELPGSLHSLIISRIDRLAEGPKTTLKVASVIGRLFRASWLWGSYPQLGDSEQVTRHLAELGRLELTPLDKPEPELEYLFKHIVTREVAYESLAVATRTMLHAQIGAYIERTYADNLDRYLDLLAYHYGQSANTDRQRVYFARAAAVAQANFANDVALGYYRRLLPLLPDAEKSAVYLQLGEVEQLIGQWDAAEASYMQALALAEARHSAAQAARCRQMLGALQRARGAYDAALDWLAQAQAGFGAAEMRAEQANVLREIGIVHWYQGAYDAALDHFSRSRALAAAIADRKGVYRSVGNMGLIYWHQEKYAQALAAFAECEHAALEINDLVGLCHTYSNVGNVQVELGHYVKAMANYMRALQMALELGYRQGMSYSIGNMGNVYWYQGEHAAALVCYARDLEIALDLGDRQGVGFAAWNVARTYLAGGEVETADRLLTQAVTLARLLDTPYDLCSYLFELGNARAARRQPDAAFALFEEAQALAARVENETIAFEAQVSLVRLAVEMGRVAAETAVAQLEALLAEADSPARRATLHYEIWQLAPAREGHRQAAADLYRDLYAATPSQEYRHNHARLTGDTLPAPPPLPPLPEAVTRHAVSVEALMVQIALLLAEIRAGGE
ncbi:MAG: tetratricopeptide repeat protein [Anaerolineales bacterium]|nr:tetratricopeptide repeat protein [Anaerolineales bacterium]